VAFAFSNAFFEHLYRPQRLPHLRRIRESLEADGVCCYIGVPYFRNIAKFYLEKAPGTLGPVFDLYNVYRYTHGDPEHQPAWWLGQLHKSLFRRRGTVGPPHRRRLSVVRRVLLRVSGRRPRASGDHGLLRIARGPRRSGRQRNECLRFLERFADQRIRLGTLVWLSAAEAPAPVTSTTMKAR